MGRPYGQAYPYVPYPGYVLPQQMMHPLDYRRMFEPRFHPPPWADMPRPPAQQPPQYQYPPPPPSPLRRETACSEVQTDPSDAINQLLECLGRMRGVELGGAERELDSGVGSQASSGIFSPVEEKKSEEEGVTRGVAGSCSSSSFSGAQPSPGVAAFSDSVTAVYDAETSHRSPEGPGAWPGAWPGGFEEPPLDSSSVREEAPSGVPEPAGKRDLFTFCLPGPLPGRAPAAPRPEERPADAAAGAPVDLVCDPEEAPPETEAVLPQAAAATAPQARGEQCPTAAQEEVEADLSYRILRLPFEPSAPLAGDLPRSSPSGRLASSCLSSPVSPLYYGFLPRQKTQERMSVLSPSLDELSSRDDMFSTDLDDMDLFPRRMSAVAGSRRPAGKAGRTSGHLTTEEAWPAAPGAERYSCACCGKGLAKAAGRSKGGGDGGGGRAYRDETGDSDDGCRYARSQPDRALARKQAAAPRKAESVSLRHAPKHPPSRSSRRAQCEEGSSVADGEEGRDRRLEDGGGGGGQTGELTSGDLQYRTCQGKVHL